MCSEKLGVKVYRFVWFGTCFHDRRSKSWRL